MSLLLGHEFVARVLEPEPTPADRYAELAAAIAASLDRVHAAIAALPAPIVQVDEPDLSAIVTAVNGLKPSVDAADIASAIADALNVPTQPSETDVVLGKVLADLGEKLGLLEFRLKGVGVAAAPLNLPNDPTRQLGQVSLTGQPIAVSGTTSADVTDRVGRLVGHVNVDNLPATQTVTQATVTTQLDYDVRTDGNPVYLGTAAVGTTTGTATWTVKKITYDSSNRATAIQVATGAWTNRAALAYS